VSGACLLGCLLQRRSDHADFAWWAIEYQGRTASPRTQNALAWLGVGALCGVMAALLGRRRQVALVVADAAVHRRQQ